MSEFKDKTILVVDDSTDDLQLTLNVIKDHYKVLGAKSGEQALQLIPKANVDVVLLDVNMPVMDGYQTCVAIKQLEQPPAVIFISANDSTEEISKGYEVGGEDYLIKPYSSPILLNKIESTIKLTEHIGSLEKNATQASNVAMSAMSSSGEMSILVNCLRRSFEIKTLDDLGALVLDTLSQYGLKGTVQLRTPYSAYNYGESESIPPLEIELLNRIAMIEERIIDKGARFFLNDKAVSILIKNMPIDNEDLLGRLRDYLAIIIEGINEKTLTLGHEIQASTERNNKVTQLISEAEISLRYALDTQQQLEKGNVEVLQQLEKTFQDAFLSLGLTETQEHEIMEFLDAAEQESIALFEKSTQVNTELQSVITKFRLLKE